MALTKLSRKFLLRPSKIMKQNRIELDWKKLFGFKLAAASQGQCQAASGKLGAKLGGKLGVKVGAKPGLKPV